MRETINTYPPEIAGSLPKGQLLIEYNSLVSAYQTRGIELKDSEKRCEDLYNEFKEVKNLSDELVNLLKTAMNYLNGLMDLVSKPKETVENIFNRRNKTGPRAFIKAAKRRLEEIFSVINGTDTAQKPEEEEENREGSQISQESGSGENEDVKTKPSEKDEEENDNGGIIEPEEGDGKGRKARQRKGKTESEPEKDDKKDNPDPQEDKKKKGNKNLRRKAGYVINSFVDKENVIVRIDPIWGSLEDIQRQLGATDPSQIRFSSDVQCYIKGEMIDGRVYPSLHISPKFRMGNATWRNPHAERLLHASVYDPAILKQTVFLKYNLGLPMNRIEQHMLEDMNLDMQRSRLEEWSKDFFEKGLKYLLFSMLDYVVSRPVAIGDETYVLSKEKAGNCYYWVIRTSELDPEATQMVLFLFDKSRSALIPQFYFDGFQGKFLVDGYDAYPTFVDRVAGVITLANCWQHSRRPMEKCALSPKEKEEYEKKYGEEHWTVKCWNNINTMFSEEKRFKDMTPEERLDNRKGKMFEAAQDVIKTLEMVKAESMEYRLDEDCRKAIDYILDRRDQLFVIFTDGRVPLSTNSLETMNIIIALGRDNWKAFDTMEGGFRGGGFFSLVASARAESENVSDYLEFVTVALPYVVRDVGEENLKAFDAYWNEKKERLEQARENLKKRPGKDPELNLSDLKNKKPDISAFQKLFTDSLCFKAFKAIKAEKERELHQTIADAVSLKNLTDSGFTPDQVKRMLESVMKDKKVPEEAKASVRRILNLLTAEEKPADALDAEQKPADPNSIDGVRFAERADLTPEFLTDPEAVLKRYGLWEQAPEKQEPSGPDKKDPDTETSFIPTADDGAETEKDSIAIILNNKNGFDDPDIIVKTQMDGDDCNAEPHNGEGSVSTGASLGPDDLSEKEEPSEEGCGKLDQTDQATEGTDHSGPALGVLTDSVPEGTVNGKLDLTNKEINLDVQLIGIPQKGFLEIELSRSRSSNRDVDKEMGQDDHDPEDCPARRDKPPP